MKSLLFFALGAFALYLLDFILTIFAEAPGSGYVCDPEALSPVWDDADAWKDALERSLWN